MEHGSEWTLIDDGESIAPLDLLAFDYDKIGCDKNGCDVLVGKQSMRPAFGLPDGRCVIPFPQPLTQAIPTKEACHV
jgi:hypothetical protein